MRLWLLILVVILCGCGGQRTASPRQSAKATVDNIESHLKAIDEKASPTVPEVKEHTDAIRTETKQFAAVDKTVKALRKENDKLRSQERRWLSWLTAGTYGLGVLTIVGGFLFRSPQIILAGIGALVAGAIASFVFQWAWAFGIGGVVLAGLYAFFQHRKALVQNVTQQEWVKTALAKEPDALDKLYKADDSVANAIQSKGTKKLVKSIRNTKAIKAINARIAEGATTE